MRTALAVAAAFVAGSLLGAFAERGNSRTTPHIPTHVEVWQPVPIDSPAIPPTKLVVRQWREDGANEDATDVSRLQPDEPVWKIVLSGSPKIALYAQPVTLR